MKTEIPTFDIADYLDSEEIVAAYLNEIIQENDVELLLSALGDISRAKGMSEVAKSANLGRESLYKSLKKGANPRFTTVLKVLNALGVQLTISPKQLA